MVLQLNANSVAKTGKRKRSRPRRRRQRGGKLDFQKAIEKTGMEFQIPGGYNYAGPGTKNSQSFETRRQAKNQVRPNCHAS